MNTTSLHKQFEHHFGKPSAGSYWMAPGRINLIGEHTDYNGGFVFPGAVTQAITALIQPTGTRTVRLWAVDLGQGCEFSIDDAQGPTVVHFRYVYGIVRELMEHGVEVQGFDAVYQGDVPLGAGMSSSAALECCFANALNELFHGGLDKMTLALAGQATEHKYIGVKCGIMDQFISMFGREGCLVRLDCRSGEYAYFPWHPEGYRLVLVDSCIKHILVGSPYNDRRLSCERVAHLAGVETLRDCTRETIESLKPSLSDEDYRRARFVYGECERVLAVSNALEQGDYITVGQQMFLTHEGLSRDYEVSCAELDFLVDLARDLGATGARIMGGGFGGCSINLLSDEVYDTFVTEVPRRYEQHFRRQCRIIPVAIGGGASRIMNV